MTHAILMRHYTDAERTLGTLRVVGHQLTLSSLELPRFDKYGHENVAYTTCILPGNYKVRRDKTGKHQYFRLLDVKDRTLVEIHVANWVRQLLGCIALGLYYKPSKDMLKHSRVALNLLLDIVGDDNWTLEIIDDY